MRGTSLIAVDSVLVAKSFIASGWRGFNVVSYPSHWYATKRPWPWSTILPWFGVCRNGARSGVCVGGSFVSGLVSGGVVVVEMYEVSWRGLPHQHIVGFHSLELYILEDSISVTICCGKRQSYIPLGGRSIQTSRPGSLDPSWRGGW